MDVRLRRKINVPVRDVLEAVLASDSELSGLSDGDDDDDWPDDEPNEHNDSSSDNKQSENESSSDDEPLSNIAGTRRQVPRQNSTADYNFKRRKYTSSAHDFVIDNVDDNVERTPYEHFKTFVSHDMLASVVFESNQYAMQKNGILLQLTTSELEVFLGIYFQMGLARMPAVGCYWQAQTRYGPIADAMSRNRFMQIASNLHFVDNLQHDPANDDRIWKIRPWLEGLRQSFGGVTAMEFQSIDEIMVAFKGRSIVKQYMPKKPTKWGIKLWGRCSVDGFLHDFDVYQGKGTGITNRNEEIPNCGIGGNVVIQLCSTLPPPPKGISKCVQTIILQTSE